MNQAKPWSRVVRRPVGHIATFGQLILQAAQCGERRRFDDLKVRRRVVCALTAGVLPDGPLGELLDLRQQSIVLEERQLRLSVRRLAYYLAKLSEYHLVYNGTHLAEYRPVACRNWRGDLDGVIIVVLDHLREGV